MDAEAVRILRKSCGFEAHRISAVDRAMTPTRYDSRTQIAEQATTSRSPFRFRGVARTFGLRSANSGNTAKRAKTAVCSPHRAPRSDQAQKLLLSPKGSKGSNR